jgi:dTDP-4-amino-4,6-dideoxy-D-galactose acyltransferase
MALVTDSMLKPLPWDSAHFGIDVARIEPAKIDDCALEDLLLLSKRKKFSLVYWTAPASRNVPAEILQKFSGRHVDRKATYVLDFSSWTGRAEKDFGQPHVSIVKYPRGAATAALRKLGRAAGEFSRFVVDPRIPLTKANELFEVWADKSTAGEMAEAVFVAGREDRREAIVGLVTVSREQDDGQIGLIAVDSNYREMGIGTALVRAANRWMLGNNLARGWVVTQGANSNACRLYGRLGYKLHHVENVYHFWPLAQPCPL